MNPRSNQALIGIILSLLGVLMILQNIGTFGIGTLTELICGMAFLLLYRTKKKTWALIVGTYLAFFGLVNVLKSFGLGGLFSEAAAGSAFFLLPGVIFLLLYFQRNKRALLLPGTFMIWIGIYSITARLPFLDGHGGGYFLICLGMGGLCAYFIGRSFTNRILQFISICFVVAGSVNILHIGPDKFAWASIGRVFPFVLIAAGVLVILAARRK